jgi:hypothetical protein
MSEIQRVVVHLGPNRISEGFYTVEGDTLTMVFPNGASIPLDDPELTSAHLKPGDNARAIAGILTKKIRTAFLGEQVEGFSRELDYQRMYVV